ncbi:hypothetical protein GJ744_005640 [Endocarpon pusillum]|uniref:Beta-lactamase-related domain-containing protein n=1 Tax=Endocarpon pusillum TaxID=364733 RepID=A0A8H7A7R1_9EURO|nr:hypothetical protein GJ744_005640 [Endocarpon pusillum]
MRLNLWATVLALLPFLCSNSVSALGAADQLSHSELHLSLNNPYLLKARFVGDYAPSAAGNAHPEKRASTPETYFGKTGTYHQSRVDALHSSHYIGTISVHGDRNDPRYTVTWVPNKGGPMWQAAHGLDFNGFNKFFDDWVNKQGYVLTKVAATGPADNPIYALVAEKRQPAPGSWTKPSLTKQEFDDTNDSMRKSNMYLNSVATFGSGANRRYAACWLSDDKLRKWHYREDTIAAFQTAFDEESSMPGWYPQYVSLDGDKVHYSIWSDVKLGSGYSVQHGMDQATAEAKTASLLAAGSYPIMLSGGGVGSATRYTAAWATNDIPLARSWTANGIVTAHTALANAENIMKDFMQKNAIRAAQLAVSQNGILKMARGYTWAEPGYHVTQPTDRFLLASNSKMFLEAAIQSLYDNHSLDPNTKVYPKLGFTNPKDTRSNDITVQQLLDHTGGFDRTGPTGDPNYTMRQISLALSLTRPATKSELCKYIYQNKMLDYKPGMPPICPAGQKPPCFYSNYGYILASLLVEKVTGQEFFAYVNSAILAPDSISEVEIWKTSPANRPSTEVPQEDSFLGLSALDPTKQIRVPAIYGGDGTYKESSSGADGLGASARALVQFIWRHAVWGNGGRITGARRGSTPGAATWASSLDGGIDFAFVLNTRELNTPNNDPTPLEAALTNALAGQTL